MGDFWNSQWLNQNTQRAYPLQYGQSATDLTAVLTIPDNLLADMNVYGTVASLQAVSTTAPTEFYIRQVQILATSITLIIASNIGDIAIAAIPSNAPDYSTHTLSGATGSRANAGFITIGSLADFSIQLPGVYNFSNTATRLEMSAVRYELGRSIVTRVAQHGKVERTLIGSYTLNAGSNIKFVSAANGLEISAVNVDDLQPVCNPVTDFWRYQTPVKLINGVPARNSDGQFFMLADACTDLEAVTNGIRLNNKCGTPCCSDSELDSLTDEIDTVVNAFTALETLVQSLETTLQQFEQTVIAARND